MACLVKITADDIFIALNHVYAPGYTLTVSSLNSSSPVVDGWKYFSDTKTREDFPAKWRQPRSAQDAYAKGDHVFWNGKIWESLILGNVWEPGVSAWREVTAEDGTPPAWIQPTGAHDAYVKGAIVSHAGKLWKNTGSDANVWEPGVFGWSVYTTLLPDTTPSIPAWVQPTGAGDAYPLNAIVTHNGFTWQNTGSAANVWEPGVFGWVQI